uniref:Long-chain-fatty-acid--CoA ligase n=1 Tax=Syphacia muris TaxID=451379 RepID=A0A158R5P1_9BILA
MEVLLNFLYSNCYCIIIAAILIGTWLKWLSWLLDRTYPPLDPTINYKHQTRQLPDGSRVTYSLTGTKLKSYVYDDIRTAYDAIFRGLRVSHNGPMLGIRKKLENGKLGPYVWMNYRQVINKIDAFADGLYSLGCGVGQNVFFGLYSKNRPEWVISEYSIYKMNSVVVPLYDTLGRQAVDHIIKQCNLQTVICDSNDKAIALMKNGNVNDVLKRIIVMDTLNDKTIDIARDYNFKLLQFDDVQSMGKNAAENPIFQKPKPSDISTVCYTSGTTGIPKGVVLTHANMVATTVMFFHVKHFTMTPDQVLLSFLPLAHMYERICENAAILIGGRIGYYSGDVKKLIEDIELLRPTVVPLVPRVLNRIYDNILNEARKNPLKLLILKAAILWKSLILKRHCLRNNTWADKIVFQKIRDKMGGRLKLIFSGAAPAAPEVLQFCRVVLGCSIIEGYVYVKFVPSGQTECVAACTGTLEGDFTAGHVGTPLMNTAIKLVDTPEIGYFAANNEGEVCIKGPNVFSGYYQNLEATNEALDADGWLHTGDIGSWNPNGSLRIIDRKKFIFKLQQGEYIAPEKLENIYIKSVYVAQVFVYGDSLKSSLIGVVVPDEEMLKKLAARRFHISNVSLKEICRNDQIKAYVLKDMNEIDIFCMLFTIYIFQIKDIYLEAEPFSVKNGLLTPTLKNRRNDMKRHYSSQISKMYAKLL